MTIELAGAAEAAGVDSPIEMVIQGSSGSFSQEIPPQNLVMLSEYSRRSCFPARDLRCAVRYLYRPDQRH